MKIKIASRTSPLALWQSKAVQQKLSENQVSSIIEPIESTGDLQLTQAIYSLGISGVFTKELDAALLHHHADIAVHSLKDVPTELAKGLVLSAVLERAAFEDLLLFKRRDFLNNTKSHATIATSSLRRQAQWKAKFPHHHIVPIRGNVQTRLKKYQEDSNIDAVIFAKAGLERLNLIPQENLVLNWMIPAPAQGIIGIVCREADTQTQNLCQALNHLPSFQMAQIERDFMNTLQGGCSVPIAALAQIQDEHIVFVGAIHDFHGQEFYQITKQVSMAEMPYFGKRVATEFLQQKGVQELLHKIKTTKPE